MAQICAPPFRLFIGGLVAMLRPSSTVSIIWIVDFGSGLKKSCANFVAEI